MLLNKYRQREYLVDEVVSWSNSYASLWKYPTEDDRYFNVGEEMLTWYFVKWIISHQIPRLSKLIQYNMIWYHLERASIGASPTQINFGMWNENDLIYSNPPDTNKNKDIYLDIGIDFNLLWPYVYIANWGFC